MNFLLFRVLMWLQSLRIYVPKPTWTRPWRASRVNDVLLELAKYLLSSFQSGSAHFHINTYFQDLEKMVMCHQQIIFYWLLHEDIMNRGDFGIINCICDFNDRLKRNVRWKFICPEKSHDLLRTTGLVTALELET